MNHYLVSRTNGAQIGLQAVIKQYERPNLLKALWQLANTFIPYIILCALMYLSYKAGFPYWITIGFKAYALIQFPIIFFAGVIGVWLFYIQHQFEGVYWSRHEHWDPTRASLCGSSYYKLPAVIRWFTGNIGLHHIHHLRARIPNYNLQKAYNDTKTYLNVEPLTIRKSFACLQLKLWDEKEQKLVGFRSVNA